MTTKSFETKWKTALTNILEELTESQFKKMLFDLNKIPQGVKDGKVREEIPQIIIQYFGTEESINVMDKEMRQIPRMDAAIQDLLRPFVEKLKKQRQKKKEAVSKAEADSGAMMKKPADGAMSTAAANSASMAKTPKRAADQRDSSDTVKPKKKTEMQKPTGSTKTPKTDPAGPAKPKQKQTEKQKSTGSTKTSKTDPAGPAKPKQKQTEKQKSTGSTKTSKGKSAAVQAGVKKAS